MRIDRIEASKHKRGRVLVFLADGSLLKVTEQELLVFGLRPGLELGQVKKGIPVWMTGEESKFPGMPYIIFPGNVGEVSTLKEIVEELI